MGYSRNSSANAKKGQALSKKKKKKIRNKQGQVSFQAGKAPCAGKKIIKSSYENYLADIHLKLLYKLSCFGVKGNTLNWIQSFLIGRTQTVVLEGESSNDVPVTSGVGIGPAPLSSVHK